MTQVVLIENKNFIINYALKYTFHYLFNTIHILLKLRVNLLNFHNYFIIISDLINLLIMQT
jgi:hypothetical protein